MKKRSGFFKEFKEFILRGNVMDMAVGVIVGGAFTAIVTSLNQDILTPVLGVFGGVDFSNLFVKLGTTDTAPILMYGNFITAIINFLITALVIFILVRAINRVNKRIENLDILNKEEEKDNSTPTEKECPHCLSQIPIKATKCKYCTSEVE